MTSISTQSINKTTVKILIIFEDISHAVFTDKVPGSAQDE